MSVTWWKKGRQTLNFSTPMNHLLCLWENVCVSVCIIRRAIWVFKVVIEEVDFEKKIIFLLDSSHYKFLADNGWKCNISITNQLHWKEEDTSTTYTCPSKIYFSYFCPLLLFLPLSSFLEPTIWALLWRHRYFFLS